MTQPTPEAAKIHSLHGLRGLMAIWVVVGHISLTFGWGLPLVERNTLAVDVFVLLSGFVITMLIERKREPYGPYIVRRGFRLFPLYLAGLIASAILLPVQSIAWTSAPEIPTNLNRLNLIAVCLSRLWFHVAVHLPLAQGLIPRRIDSQAAYTIIGQAWSISLEWQFYLVAPMMLWAAQLADLRKTLAGMLVIILLCLSKTYFSDAYLGARALHFLLGILSFYAMRRTRGQGAYLAAGAAVAAAIVLLNGKWQLIPLAIWAAVLWSSAQRAHSGRHSLARLLGSPSLFQLGELSFSIYLLHMIPLYCSLALLARICPVGSLPMQLAVGAFTLAASYAGAMLTYRWIERPGMELGARLSRKGERRDQPS